MAEKIKDTLIEKMFEAGAHFGYSRSRRHPSTKEYVFCAKNNIEIFDLEKTQSGLEEAKTFISTLAADGKTILFVGTKPEARKHMTTFVVDLAVPYVIEKWIGGTFTNFSQIKKRISRLKDLLDKKEKGELSVYTKKERLLIDREIAKLQKNFGGIVDMDGIPDALFVIDPKKEENAVTEAFKKNVPIIALASSDCDITNIDYPIPANDSSSPSIKLFLEEVMDAYKDGTKNQKKVEPKTEDKEKTEKE